MFVSPINQNSSLNFSARGYRTMLNAENNAIGSDEALLMLQDPKSAVIFKQNQKEAKKANDDIQKMTDKFIKEVDTVMEHKEKEVMEI